MGGFDWGRHWAEHDENEAASRFALFMADRLDGFLDWRRVSSFADFGCGPATMMLALARRHPETVFHGYDSSGTIIAKDTARAAEAGLRNVAFGRAVLPDIDAGRGFDVITCLSSLHYVERIEEAIRNLFRAVRGGGLLLLNYPNTYTHHMYRRDVKQDDEETRTRFTLVLNGRNLVTQRTIQRVTGVRPRRFHSAIRGNIYVTLHKPWPRRRL